MKMRRLFLINALVQFMFGLGFLFAPAVALLAGSAVQLPNKLNPSSLMQEV